MKRNLITLLFSLFGTCIFAAESVTILHTNDIHGNYAEREIKKDDGTKIMVGGFLAIQQHVQRVKNETAGRYLLLDAGDYMTGNPICDIDYQGIKGGAMVSFFNYIGYHGMTLGNHEFDISVDNCRGLMNLCNFPVVSANVFLADSSLFAKQAYHIYEIGNLRIGVIGLTVHPVGDYLNRPQRDQIFTEEPLPIARSIAEKIDPETDLIVVLSHCGIEVDRILADSLGGLIDVIVGGHSHTQLNKPVDINGVVIVQTGSRGSYLGRLDLMVEEDKVQLYQAELISLETSQINPDQALAREIEKYNNLINLQYGKVIGKLKTMWVRNSIGESNIGNFIADCIRSSAEADFAVLNSGGIRKGLVPGPIKAIDIKEILPFMNSICVFSMTGEQVLQLIQMNIDAAHERSSGILQVSGLKYRWRHELGGKNVILSASINGEPVIADKLYKGATLDYVIANREKYLGTTPFESTNLYFLLSDIVINAIKERKLIESKVEGRIVKE